MGYYGGWSVKPQLGLSNVMLGFVHVCLIDRAPPTSFRASSPPSPSAMGLQGSGHRGWTELSTSKPGSAWRPRQLSKRRPWSRWLSVKTPRNSGWLALSYSIQGASAVERLCTWIGLMCIIYIVAVFVFLRSGTKDMKSSQQYPRQFGHQVASHHISYMLSETCLRAVVIPNMQTNIYIYIYM